MIASILLSTLDLHGGEERAKFLIPDHTLSPDGRYGVTVPVFDLTLDDETGITNNLVEVGTGRVLTTIRAETGYDRALNHRAIKPSRWSADGALLLWEVDGKWSPNAFVLLKLEDGKVVWQRDLLRLAEQAILERTRKASPEKYAAAKKDNAGNGSAYPEGFTIDVEARGPVSFPLRIRAILTSDPKGISAPPLLESFLDAVVDQQGKFKVRDFALGHAESSHF